MSCLFLKSLKVFVVLIINFPIEDFLPTRSIFMYKTIVKQTYSRSKFIQEKSLVLEHIIIL